MFCKKEGVIEAVGRSMDIENQLKGSAVDLTDFDIIDARGKAVLPGFVDSHTHLVFGGYRAEEFSWRLLSRAKELGLKLKLHADEIVQLGVSTVEKVIKQGNPVFDKEKGGIIHC